MSDPKLNLIFEASLEIVLLFVEGNEKTRVGLDFFEPKLYEGTAFSGFNNRG